MGLCEVIRSCRGALTNEISALMKHLVSYGKHSELDLMHGTPEGPLTLLLTFVLG